MTRPAKVVVTVVVAALILAGFALVARPLRCARDFLRRLEPVLMGVTVRPVGVMGTDCAITAVVSSKQTRPVADEALRQAEAALRRVEARMSAYIELSELSKLNAAQAGTTVALSPETREVIRLSKDLHARTKGAFDVTCLPVFRLWGQAGREKRLPAEADLAAARAACGWERFEAVESGLRKTRDAAGIGLGGIAKGYAIDRAIEAMKGAGARGGLVDVGGDIRCFGPSPRGDRWRIGIRDPFDPAGGQFLGMLQLTERAVCTSGNYFRFVEIDGKRYSHIIDPRTGRPVDFAPSVTVVAPTAAVADGWATALSVLGTDGLKLIPPDGEIEAMIVVGGPGDYTVHQTPGFARLLVRPVPTSGKAEPRKPPRTTAPAKDGSKPSAS